MFSGGARRKNVMSAGAFEVLRDEISDGCGCFQVDPEVNWDE